MTPNPIVQDHNHPVRSIGIIGGGSAGYISALYLKKALPHLEITILESSRIPVIGVGEATTTPAPRFLHQHMGFSVAEFVAQAKPTLKLGIQFLWGDPERHHFNSPFGHTHNLQAAVTLTGDPTNESLLSMLMERNRTPFFRTRNGITALPGDDHLAYHIDNQHFLAYLRSKLQSLAIHHLDTEVEQVHRAPDGGVAHLSTSTLGNQTFDLYLDCSGFRSILLGKHLETPWVDYSPSLKTNRAIVGKRPNPGEVIPHTTARTLNHGWLWNTPMQHEDHLGYVFSSHHCTDDEAFEELSHYCPSLQHGRVVNFRPGRHAEPWRKNVVGIGNAFAFIEPLESTGIHMVLRHLKSLTKALNLDSPIPDATRDDFNRSINARWDHLRWFIALHFRFNRKLDTPFWRDCRETVDVSAREDYINFFHRNGPLSAFPNDPLHQSLDQDALFSVSAHDAQMAGAGINPESLKHYPPDRHQSWQQTHAINRALVAQALTHREALAHLAQQ